MKKIITILMMLFPFAGMSTMDAKPFWKGKQTRISRYTSMKYKKKIHKRSTKNYRNACKYHSWYLAYTKK